MKRLKTKIIRYFRETDINFILDDLLCAITLMATIMGFFGCIYFMSMEKIR